MAVWETPLFLEGGSPRKHIPTWKSWHQFHTLERERKKRSIKIKSLSKLNIFCISISSQTRLECASDIYDESNKFEFECDHNL